jgi:5'-nucleotidase
MNKIKISILLVLLPMSLLGWGNAVAEKSRGAENSREVNLQILAINDFHGNIATSSGSFGGTGRADFLAANIQAAEAGADNSIFVSAGDLIGASPLISALFHDEPTIEAMNLMGLDING